VPETRNTDLIYILHDIIPHLWIASPNCHNLCHSGLVSFVPLVWHIADFGSLPWALTCTDSILKVHFLMVYFKHVVLFTLLVQCFLQAVFKHILKQWNPLFLPKGISLHGVSIYEKDQTCPRWKHRRNLPLKLMLSKAGQHGCSHQ
jgi:hypothetical protein